MGIAATLLGKVSDEAARYAESNGLRRISADFGKFAFAVSLALALSYPSETLQYVWRIVSAFNFFALKFAFSCVLGFMVLPRIWKRYHGEENEECAEGVPVSELLDHLFSAKSFRRDDAERIFAMPRNRYQSLAKRMDDLGIFVRGENNSRVLNPDLSRREVAALVRWTPSPSDEISGNSGELEEPVADAVETDCETELPPDGNRMETEWKPVPIAEAKR